MTASDGTHATQKKFNPQFSVTSPNKEADEKSLIKLLASLTQKGASFGPIALQHPVHSARGLFLTAAVKRKDVIIRLPLELAYKLRDLSQLPVNKSQDEAFFNQMFNKNSITKNALLDVIELNENQTTEFYPGYLELLPESFTDFPIFFNEVFLDATCFGARVRHYIRYLIEEHSTLSIEGRLQRPLDLFIWMYLVMQTRGLEADGGMYLAPVIELVNHSNMYNNCVFGYNDITNSIDVLALQDIVAGSEILFSYREELCPVLSLLVYNMFPESCLLERQEAIYGQWRNRIYNLGRQQFGSEMAVLIADTIADFVSFQEGDEHRKALYQTLAEHFSQLINDRQKSQPLALAAAASDWERKVIRFVYQQEQGAYTKAYQLFIDLIKHSKLDASDVTPEQIQALTF